jgi:uncharacterized protein (TIGR02596 family)
MTIALHQRSGQKAFSLIELLTVLSIISVLAVATVPALKGTLDAFNVSGAADLAGSEISLARQMAISRNLPVEVRIYKDQAASGDAWRIIALVIPAIASGATDDEWVTGGKILPGNVLFEDTGDFSTLISEANPYNATTPVAPWSQTEVTNAPALVRGKEYIAFQFKPDGSTNLPSVNSSNLPAPWCLTLKGASAAPAPSGTGPSANYVAIVLDSLTGRSLTYQP